MHSKKMRCYSQNSSALSPGRPAQPSSWQLRHFGAKLCSSTIRRGPGILFLIPSLDGEY
ncbi:hypothetical protein BDR07DRAFT_1396638 [Suillus spraguei]|nr:hypothetical protein BDR07DRAFT_1443594 [Suillus spraguei]KAG2366283.1 hypothetical protein BDR07DRAFT_1396638 [Suillus spraguei]